MGLMKHIHDRLWGKVHFYIFLGKKPAAEVLFRDSEIIVEIKSPILATQAAVEEMLRKKHLGSNRLKKLKELGYKIKVRYKMIEFEM